MWLACIALIYSFASLQAESIDLEAMQQDFVLETKQIVIPQYPDAFNPSIIRWKDEFLMIFRARDKKTGMTNVICLLFLDENFDPKGKPQVLKFPDDPLAGNVMQDPRLIQVKDKLYIVYSNTWRMPNEEIRRVFIAELKEINRIFTVKDPQVFLRFEADQSDENKYEKNWTPFEYNGDLLLAYSLNPHRIFLPHFGKKKCTTIAETQMECNWNWGKLRGGSQAFKIGNQYLGFFHSTKIMKSKHSKGKSMPHYFMGAYTFEANPPFAITKVSPEIIVGKNFYNGPSHNTWKPLRVVFPCGYVYDNNNIWVTYGRQDHEMWIVKLDRKKLLQSLVPVQKSD